MSRIFDRRELVWLTPFLAIALSALGLFRALPRFPAPAHGFTVVGSDGVAVKIAQPLRGVALAPPVFPGGFLEDTLSPQLLMYVGHADARKSFADTMMGWIFPEVADNDRLWNSKLFRNTTSPFVELETLLAYDPTVYLGCGASVRSMRDIGLPVLVSGGSCGGRQKPMWCPGSPVPTYWAHYPEGPLFIQLRVDDALIGRPELADARIASYCEALKELEQELQPATLTYRPRVLMEGEYKGDFDRVGVIDALAGRRIPGDDDERTLILDPDIIFLVGTAADPEKYMSDPRRQGLKAVRDRRVYKWSHGGIAYKPAGIRWLAEIAHPDRLQPEARQLLRDRVMSYYGYRLSDDQIDQLLDVDKNSSSAGGARFTRAYQATANQDPQR